MVDLAGWTGVERPDARRFIGLGGSRSSAVWGPNGGEAIKRASAEPLKLRNVVGFNKLLGWTPDAKPELPPEARCIVPTTSELFADTASSSELGATAAAVGPSHRRDRRTAAEMREEARAMRARRVAVETSQRIAELHPPRERREASQRRHHQLNLVVGGAAPVPSSLRGADPGGALLDAMRVRGPLPPKPALFRDHIRDLSQAASVAAAQELAARGESGKTEVWFGWEERPSLSEQAVAGEAAGADGDADSGTRDGTVGEKRSGAKRRSASARTMTTAPASARERGGAGQGAKGPRGSETTTVSDGSSPVASEGRQLELALRILDRWSSNLSPESVTTPHQLTGAAYSTAGEALGVASPASSDPSETSITTAALTRIASREREQSQAPSFARATHQSAWRLKDKAMPVTFSGREAIAESEKSLTRARAGSARATRAAPQAAVDARPWSRPASGTTTSAEDTRVRQRLMERFLDNHTPQLRSASRDQPAGPSRAPSAATLTGGHPRPISALAAVDGASPSAGEHCSPADAAVPTAWDPAPGAASVLTPPSQGKPRSASDAAGGREKGNANRRGPGYLAPTNSSSFKAVANPAARTQAFADEASSPFAVGGDSDSPLGSCLSTSACSELSGQDTLSTSMDRAAKAGGAGGADGESTAQGADGTRAVSRADRSEESQGPDGSTTAVANKREAGIAAGVGVGTTAMTGPGRVARPRMLHWDGQRDVDAPAPRLERATSRSSSDPAPSGSATCEPATTGQAPSAPPSGSSVAAAPTVPALSSTPQPSLADAAVTSSPAAAVQSPRFQLGHSVDDCRGAGCETTHGPGTTVEPSEMYSIGVELTCSSFGGLPWFSPLLPPSQPSPCPADHAAGTPGASPGPPRRMAEVSALDGRD